VPVSGRSCGPAIDPERSFSVAKKLTFDAIDSPMLPNLKKNKDASLTMYIQKGWARQRAGIELAPGTRRPDLLGNAAVLADDQPDVGPAAWGRR